MPIKALLSIDEGQSLNEETSFEVKPEIGDHINFWKDGRTATGARVTAIGHHQVEGGFILVVEAETNSSVYETRGILKI